MPTTRTEASLARLENIVDLLGPNMWLHLDDVSFSWFFGGPLRQDSDGLAQAGAFADRTGCVFVPDPNAGTAKFGRAYFEKDS